MRIFQSLGYETSLLSSKHASGGNYRIRHGEGKKTSDRNKPSICLLCSRQVTAASISVSNTSINSPTKSMQKP